MFRSIGLCLGTLVRLLRARRNLLLENLALRQQLAVLKRRHPRPRLELLDKIFWVAVRRFWSGWQQSLIAVTPETVVRWHRAGFRFYWRLISRVRKPAGRRRVSKEVRDLISRMVAENPTWGAPRIHGELLMLGFDVSERIISRWMKRAPRDPEPAKRWLAFLRNHREAIAAMDFFTVPTITFGVLYCFFIVSHDRRRILHFNVTQHPTSLWIVQQLREAFPFESSPRFLIFDRDAKYGLEVPVAVRSLKVSPVRTSLESPWQNGVAERWVGSCRRDLLDHIIAFDERHLKRLLSEYVRYYHEDRTHLGLAKGTPNNRPRSIASGRVLSHERLGGLHHRYERAA
ncbi:MAG TPA: integrase core domain-containing protein [Candidatus Acidoferrum sp.]|nr:integrase core domain-containing protein [Candidatus Acidoferrum sp.]